MDTARKVSVRALRILTYTILIKAVLSAVFLICTLAGVIALRSASANVIFSEVIFLLAQAAEFINIVACVMCLGGITALSIRFVATHMTMVIVLVLECVLLMMFTAEVSLAAVNNETASTFSTIMLILYAAIILLIGAAFLFCMRGFGEVLRRENDSASAESAEKLGIIYLIINAVGAALFVLSISGGGIMMLLALSLLYLLGAILELIMYRKAYDAAFRYWRKHAFGISE